MDAPTSSQSKPCTYVAPISVRFSVNSTGLPVAGEAEVMLSTRTWASSAPRSPTSRRASTMG